LDPVLSCSNNNVNITGVDFGILSFVIISFSGFSIDDNTRPLIGVAESDKSQGDELGVVGIIGGYLFYPKATNNLYILGEIWTQQ
jgi:hypothetical protein